MKIYVRGILNMLSKFNIYIIKSREAAAILVTVRIKRRSKIIHTHYLFANSLSSSFLYVNVIPTHIIQCDNSDLLPVAQKLSKSCCSKAAYLLLTTSLRINQPCIPSLKQQAVFSIIIPT